MTTYALPRHRPGMLCRAVLCLTLALSAIAVASPSEASAPAADAAPTPEAHTACIEATRRAERRHHLAPHLLGAISLAETGRWSPDHRASFAWPWTVTAEGRGRYLPSKAAAIAEVLRLRARGVKSIDVGCLQVNLFYHGDAFDNLNQAFDPDLNADYAAAFLHDLKEEVGTWEDAVAFYHSRDDKRGDAYQSKVYNLWYGQRQNLVAAADGDVPAMTPEAAAADAKRAQIAEARARQAEQYRMIREALASNRDFLAKQRAAIDARNAAAFEARKAQVMAEWAEIKRKRAAAKAGG